MIRHCVFVKYRAEIGFAERRSLVAGLEALIPLVPGMRSVVASANVSPEPLKQGFLDGFIVDFDDATARDAYLVHPDHQIVGGRIGAAAEGGAAGIMVFDFDLPG
jgi:hypothetical protein